MKNPMLKFSFLLAPVALTLTGIAAAQDGPQLYTLYCSACHGMDGTGATGGSFPPLAASPWVAGDADRAVKVVLKGLHGPVNVLGKTYNLEMPPQGAVLADDQLAAILSHVRTSWGNHSGAVTAAEVKAIRAATEERKTPWTADELLKLHPLPLEKTALSNLISRSYSGQWDSLPDFSKLESSNVEEEHDGLLSLKDSPFQDHFAMLWEGSFQAPADGEYEFLLDADDEAAVILGGKKIVEVRGAGPMNGSRAKVGKVTLTKGSHPFRAEFIEFTDHQGLALMWRGPGIKAWQKLSENSSNSSQMRDPLPIQPTNGRPVIYRNFIAGTTPRAIGVGFPGGFNLAWSADHLAPGMIWTGDFMDGAARWLERGTENSPPAGDHVVGLSSRAAFSKEARFRGYKLDAAGNPVFSVQIGDQILLDSWQTGADGFVRKLTLNGNGPPLSVPVSDGEAKGIAITLGEKPITEPTVQVSPGQSVTLGYRWSQ